MSLTRGQFMSGCVMKAGIEKTLHVRRAWACQNQAEGGTARNNPTNTTLDMPGATNYNSVGAKNYPSRLSGEQATVATIEEDRYATLLAAMRRNESAEDILEIWGSLPWGTSTGTMLDILGEIQRKPEYLRTLELKTIAQ